MCQTQGFAEMGVTLDVIASNGCFGVVSLQVEGKDARNCAVLSYRDGPGGWSVKSMWCIPGPTMGIDFGGEYFPSKHLGTEYVGTFGNATRVVVYGISNDVGV